MTGKLLPALVVVLTSLAAAGCAGLGGVRAPDAAIASAQNSSPTQSVLRSVLLSGGSPSSRPNPVLAFYQERDFRPAWTGGAAEAKGAADVQAVLARAHEQGLSDRDYDVAQKPPAASGPQAAAFEIRLTDALLRYARDVRTGRVAPNAAYDDVGLSVPEFDASAALAEALKNHSLAAFLADLPPAHRAYRRLAAALAHYRAIAKEGGWPSLAGAREIDLDGHDRRLSALIARLAFEDPMLAAIAKPSPAQLRDAVKRFQARNGLEQDGRVGSETLSALNVPAADRAQQIAANMERWRWLPPELESRYIAVNAADESVQFIRDGKVALRSRVIVGRKESPTPITRATIQAVVANPPWDIPGDIAARALLPHLIRNPNYLASRQMVVMDGPRNDPYGRTIAWRKIVPAEFPYAIRQLPGPNTALGVLMLDSPNDFDVYLHDTPDKDRFAADDREISNGCVRVQKIFPLASLALTGDPADGLARLNQAVKSHKTQRLALESPLPVYFLYWTAIADDDGNVEFRPDRYGRDPPLIVALNNANRGIVASKEPARPTTGEELGVDISP